MAIDVAARASRLVGRLAALTLLLPALGCYSYGPIAAADAQPGTELRAELTADGTGPAGVDDGAVDGTLVASRSDTLMLAIWRGDRSPGPRFRPQRDTLAIARPRIERLQVKRLSYLRTGLLAGGVGLGLYLVAEAFGARSEGGGPVDGPGTPTFLRVSVPVGVGPR